VRTRTLDYLHKNVDKVKDFAEDELEDVRVVGPEVTGEVVDNQGPAILHGIRVSECGLIKTLNNQAEFTT